MRRLLPAPAVDLGVASEELFAFPALTDGQAWVRGSFVSSFDGATIGPDGRSGSISSPADREVFPLLRRTSDVILVGAGTVRTESYHPSRLPMAIVSANLSLTPDLPLFAERTEASAPLVVITTGVSARSAPALGPTVDILAFGDDVIDLNAAVRDLSERGWNRIHCEGGARLLSSLLSAGLLDEILLTLSPTLIGGTAAAHLVDGVGPVPLRFTQVLEQDGTVFLRATTQRPTSAR